MEDEVAGTDRQGRGEMSCHRPGRKDAWPIDAKYFNYSIGVNHTYVLHVRTSLKT